MHPSCKSSATNKQTEREKKTYVYIASPRRRSSKVVIRYRYSYNSIHAEGSACPHLGYNMASFYPHAGDVILCKTVITRQQNAPRRALPGSVPGISTATSYKDSGIPNANWQLAFRCKRRFQATKPTTVHAELHPASCRPTAIHEILFLALLRLMLHPHGEKLGPCLSGHNNGYGDTKPE